MRVYNLVDFDLVWHLERNGTNLIRVPGAKGQRGKGAKGQKSQFRDTTVHVFFIVVTSDIDFPRVASTTNLDALRVLQIYGATFVEM
jgi:hypothetical protein